MADQITLLSAGAVKPALVKAIERFRIDQDSVVDISFATAPEIRQRLLTGQVADLTIAPADLIDRLGRTQILETANCVTLGRIGVGVMVRNGASAPKIAPVEEFKASLLKCDSIVFNQATTGLYVDSLFNRLGIAADVAAKITRYADFAAVRDHVANGHGNEIGFGATTVIIENAGSDLYYVGPLPVELQNYTTYIAALAANAADPARALLRYLAAPAAKAIFSAAGIQ
jgi:molybdate transport system substrate-binding protein